jgi:hypothetical protein
VHRRPSTRRPRSCHEKFIDENELQREHKHEFTPLEIDDASLAFDAHLEVGAGGHFLGACSASGVCRATAGGAGGLRRTLFSAREKVGAGGYAHNL